MISIPFLEPLQPETPQRTWFVTIDTDMPGVFLKAGYVLAVQSKDKWDCDDQYQTVTGDIVTIQTQFNGTVAITTPDGQRRIVPKADLEGLVIGRVMQVAPSLGALMEKMRR